MRILVRCMLIILAVAMAAPARATEPQKVQQVIGLLRSDSGRLGSYCKKDDWRFCAHFAAKGTVYSIVYVVESGYLMIFATMYEPGEEEPYGTYVVVDADADGTVDYGVLYVGTMLVVGREEWRYSNGKYCEWRGALKACPMPQGDKWLPVHQKVFDQALDALIESATPRL